MTKNKMTNLKTVFLLIDHFNWDFKKNNITRIIEKWLTKIIDEKYNFYNLKIRSYGGWKADNIITLKRYDASAFYQKCLPSIFQIRNSYVRTNFSFADYMYSVNSNIKYEIDNTLIYRKSKNYYTKNRNFEKCENNNCELKKIKKWMNSKKACTYEKCEHSFYEVFSRVEQKQIDTSIVADFINISISDNNVSHCGLMSDDLDFAPAFLTIMANNNNNVSSIRKKNIKWYIDENLENFGIEIIEV